MFQLHKYYRRLSLDRVWLSQVERSGEGYQCIWCTWKEMYSGRGLLKYIQDSRAEESLCVCAGASYSKLLSRRLGWACLALLILGHIVSSITVQYYSCEER